MRIEINIATAKGLGVLLSELLDKIEIDIPDDTVADLILSGEGREYRMKFPLSEIFETFFSGRGTPVSSPEGIEAFLERVQENQEEELSIRR
jgi:hypothetical protein